MNKNNSLEVSDNCCNSADWCHEAWHSFFTGWKSYHGSRIAI